MFVEEVGPVSVEKVAAAGKQIGKAGLEKHREHGRDNRIKNELQDFKANNKRGLSFECRDQSHEAGDKLGAIARRTKVSSIQMGNFRRKDRGMWRGHPRRSREADRGEST
jgi:hypothetical protein